MNGMVVNEWPYVVAAFALTWVVLIGYVVRLRLMPKVGPHSSPAAGSRV